ncbi:hypothetical protein ACQRIU_003934 [Beauveria bassiana]
MLSSYAEGAVKELIRDRNKPSSMLNDLLVTCRLTRGVRAIAESFGVIWPNRSELILFVTEAEVPAHGPLDPVLELLESLTFLEEEGNAAVRRVCQTALDLMKWLVGKAQTSEWWPAHRASLQWAALVARLLEEVFGVDEQAQVLIITLRELLNAPKKLRRSGGPSQDPARI